jgi:hypothetical protein
MIRVFAPAVALFVGLAVPANSAMAPAVSGASAASSTCPTEVIDGVLPTWARGGFSEQSPHMKYELGTHDEIAAILWAYPLLAPPPTTHHNKILWVSRVSDTGSTLFITAELLKAGIHSTRQVVRREVVGGPGPSIINLPVSGCWRLNLRWSGHISVLYLQYMENPAG